MHETTRYTSRIVAFAAWLFGGAAVAGGQAAPSPQLASTALLSAVMTFRLSVVESTPVNACSVLMLMDTPRDFPHAFPVSVQNVFNRRVSPCEVVEKPMADSLGVVSMRDWARVPADPGCVMIDSVRRVDSLATVYASATRHGDAVHSEEFKVVYQASRKRWVVMEVRLHGLWYPHGGDRCP